MPQIHPSQIQGISGFLSLFDQLKLVDTSSQDVDIEYQMNAEGEVTGEILWDMSSPTNPVELKRVEYAYDAEGSITTETLHIGTLVYVKEFVYENGAITRERVRKVTV